MARRTTTPRRSAMTGAQPSVMRAAVGVLMTAFAAVAVALPAAVLSGAALLAMGSPAAADPAIPMITFTGAGLGGVACSSGPDRSSVSITAGTPVDVSNQTGYRVAVDVNNAPVETSGGSDLSLADGADTQLMLDPGTWQVTLKPTTQSCLLKLNIKAATVAVTAADPAISPPPSAPVASESASPAPGGAPQGSALPSAGEPAADGGPVAGSSGHGTGRSASAPAGDQAGVRAAASSDGVTVGDAASPGTGGGTGFLPWLLIALGVALAATVAVLALRRGHAATLAPADGPPTDTGGSPAWHREPDHTPESPDAPPERPPGRAGWSWPAGSGN